MNLVHLDDHRSNDLEEFRQQKRRAQQKWEWGAIGQQILQLLLYFIPFLAPFIFILGLWRLKGVKVILVIASIVFAYFRGIRHSKAQS